MALPGIAVVNVVGLVADEDGCVGEVGSFEAVLGGALVAFDGGVDVPLGGIVVVWIARARAVLAGNSLGDEIGEGAEDSEGYYYNYYNGGDFFGGGFLATSAGEGKIGLDAGALGG